MDDVTINFIVEVFFGAFAVICAVWVISDVVKYQESMPSNKKLLWIFLAILFSIATAIVYSSNTKSKFLKFKK
jgi:hypothetical protein